MPNLASRRVLPTLLALGALALATAALADGLKLPVREVALENGMKVLLLRREGDPSVACGWAAHVGSVNERPGVTGISHLFEHMMFKGTHVVGTRDIARDLANMEAMDATRAIIREEQSTLEARQRRGEIADAAAPEHRTERHRKALETYAAQIEVEKEVLKPSDLDQIYTAVGGQGLNAGTSHDWTIYFVNLPSNRLEWWFWLESDRLMNPVFRQFYSERDVVWEERRMRTDSTPTGRLDEQFDAMFWRASPYAWPPIGWPSDLDSITRDEAEAYFERNYAPNNITACLVGDFDLDWAEQLARKYFERIPRGTQPPTPVRTFEPEQQAEQRLEAEAETEPTVKVRWPAPLYGHVDSAALSVLADVLSGTTGRLHRSLVQEQKVAVRAIAQLEQRRYGGYFEVEAIAAPGHDPEEVERAIHAELAKLREQLVSTRELQKVKNQNLAGSYRRFTSNFFTLFQILVYDVLSDWRDMETEADRLLAVTAEDVQRVVKTHFQDRWRNVAVYRTKAGAASDDPAWAALSTEQKAVATQIKAQLAGITDRARLQTALDRMSGARGQAPPEMQAVFAWVEGFIQGRIKALAGDAR
jgi:predicted Zn-dependent peptidase